MLLILGTKTKNNYKICYLKIYPSIKLKQLSVIFILNHINNLIDHAKIHMALLVSKNISLPNSGYFTLAKKCRRESCIMDLTSAKKEFASAIFKIFYFSKYSIEKKCCKKITSILGLPNLSDHTNRFLMG